MDQAVAVMQRYGDVKILIQGHTASQGTADSNKELSQKRADAVRDYLLSKGIVANRLMTSGLGEEYAVRIIILPKDVRRIGGWSLLF